MTYEETTNSIKCGDCLELIKEIPDKSIDLIVTDPPYLIDTTKAGGGRSNQLSGYRRGTMSLKRTA